MEMHLHAEFCNATAVVDNTHTAWEAAAAARSTRRRIGRKYFFKYSCSFQKSSKLHIPDLDTHCFTMFHKTSVIDFFSQLDQLHTF